MNRKIDPGIRGCGTTVKHPKSGTRRRKRRWRRQEHEDERAAAALADQVGGKLSEMRTGPVTG